MMRGWVVWAMWRRVMFTALVVSASIELGQLARSLLAGYSYRVTEIDDVILNVSGVLLGFALWSAAHRGARPRGRVRPNRRSEAAALHHEHQDDRCHDEQRDDDGPSRNDAQAAALPGLLE